MANPKLSTLVDAFTGSTINTALWSNITGGTATLDTVNDLVILQQPTVSGTANTFGSNTLYDATSSAIYAEVGPSANGNGQTRTIFKLLVDANNSVAIRLMSGVLNMTLQTAGTTVTTQLVTTYDPNAHGWWRLRESGGSWNADVSADGLNWTTLLTSSYTWAASAVAMTFVFQTSANATEASGNVATIQRVNSGLTQCGPFNVAWPILEEAYGPYWNSNSGDIPLDRYVDVTPRTEGTSATSRGTQYELDQVQAGTGSFVIQNNDGAFDPDNASGPYAGHISTTQPYRKRAQWPATRNLLTQVQATAGDLGGQPLGGIDTSNSGPSIFSITDATHGSFVPSASAWQGSTAMQFAVLSGAAASLRIVYTPQVAVRPGVTYSMTMQVRNVTATTSLQVNAFIRSQDASQTTLATASGSTVTLAGSTTAAWTTVTVTGTASANAAMMQVGLMTAATAAATCAVQVDGWQLERAAAPSTWCCPGVWQPVYAGFTDEWAAEWTQGGTYGTIAPTSFDVFGLLSQKELLDALTQEITSHSPTFLYRLDDPAGSTSASDATGQKPGAPVVTSKYGAGSLAFGTSITAANPTSGVYTGSSGTVMTLNNPNPGASGSQASTYLSLGAAGIKGPADPTAWTRMIAFRYTAAIPASGANAWSALDTAHSGGTRLNMYINGSGQFQWDLAGPSGVDTGSASAGSVCDSNWHMAMLTYSAASSSLQFFFDGITNTYIVGPTYAPTGIVGDVLGCYIDPATGQASNNWKGDISFIAEFPTALFAADMGNIYTAWKNACSGESTDARYSRILRYAGYIGPKSLQVGLTTSMGPADIAGQDALTALQAVVTTENGSHFAGRDGTVVFQARSARYNAITPVYTFGEHTDLGEWPYEDAKPTRDSTHLANAVVVTQASTGQLFSAQNAVAQVAYFPKTMARTINSSSPLECQDAAGYLLSRYQAPVTRVQTLLLHPAANPAMWAVCLNLEIGMRIRVMRRPPAAPPIQVDCFISKIDTTMTNTADATWTLQCAPVDPAPYGVFSSFHTTLNSSASAGATSITIKNGADNTNPAAAQLSQGQQLLLGLGTAGIGSSLETVTVKAVAATSPGWTTCVITLNAATVNNHSAGEIVCEPLPAGVTDPTTYDAHSMFDSTAFSY